jgi:OmpA family
MRSLLLSAAMAALLMPAAMAQSTDGADAPIMEAPGKYLVFFPWDKAALTTDDQRIVAQAAEEFRRTGSARIDVTGFTDTSGSAEYNLRLSERRAQMVADELARQGVAPNEMVVIGRGEEDLRVPTADGVREAGNRRVEIVFAVPAPAPVAEPAVEAAAPPEPVRELPKPFTFTLGALYGHNFGESDESDSNDKTQNDLAGGELTFNALPGDVLSLTLKQAVLYSFNGLDDGINGRTGLGLGLTPLNLGLVRPFLSANLGYIYGEGVQDGIVAGPELGLDFGLTDATVLTAKVAWDHQFRNADFDKGILWAGLGLGYRF